MKKNDYLEIVINILGDSLGTVPVVGGFITAIKNTGINILAVKREEKIIRALSELKNKFDDVEERFEELKNDEQFLIHFYKSLSSIGNSYDENEFRLYVNFISTYLTKDYNDEEMILLFDVISNLNPVSWKVLDKIHTDNSTTWFNSLLYYEKSKYIEGKKLGISYGDIDYKIHQTLTNLIRYGVLEEKHNMFFDGSDSGYIEDIRVGELGNNIIQLLSK
ncbi:hypothetical protein [Clostridium estertheticum]|uniref:hypothetical protein n=1 Tax=Clostridium estertheticum TaxID=238834 RepID=UPI00124D242B|nr:hypothetical protein [Clostridium estertheticum]MBZ9616799.1 hypothetical protein [Clostridium estertheticum subsp. laramiense]WAG72506.1 hypothetical protein LL032_15275 [Clostridium estertheticum]